jgi:uncharacterized protein YndB with AHSA1/START domain
MSQSESRAATAREATRSHETRIEIAAPIEEVWKALTEASEIARWFAPNIKVEPGVGGIFLADWGPGIEWKTAIEVWEPNRHLRLAETREQPEPCRLLQDYFLEVEGGKTVLRLVHSGFGTSAEWDNEYEGTRGGWPVCFFRLKHGLEHPQHHFDRCRTWDRHGTGARADRVHPARALRAGPQRSDGTRRRST